MKNLIETWERRSKKYSKLGQNAIDEIRAEGFFAMSDTYDICAEELDRKISSQPAVETGAKYRCFFCDTPTQATEKGQVCPKCGGRPA